MVIHPTHIMPYRVGSPREWETCFLHDREWERCLVDDHEVIVSAAVVLDDDGVPVGEPVGLGFSTAETVAQSVADALTGLDAHAEAGQDGSEPWMDLRASLTVLCGPHIGETRTKVISLVGTCEDGNHGGHAEFWHVMRAFGLNWDNYFNKFFNGNDDDIVDMQVVAMDLVGRLKGTEGHLCV